MSTGTYFNQMLECGGQHNQWVQNALHYYLPPEVLDEYKEKLVFISTAHIDACRVARQYCEKREVIILSERILPKPGMSESHTAVRYFIFCVLHEIAHAVKNHKSPKFDKLSPEEFELQEKEADTIAMQWFNEGIEKRNNKFLKPLTMEEVKAKQDINIQLMKEK
ncbi:MAG: hypothetical protein AB1568_06340 [Thermodesulfobacteriota bacterium]